MDEKNAKVYNDAKSRDERRENVGGIRKQADWTASDAEHDMKE